MKAMKVAICLLCLCASAFAGIMINGQHVTLVPAGSSNTGYSFPNVQFGMTGTDQSAFATAPFISTAQLAPQVSAATQMFPGSSASSTFGMPGASVGFASPVGNIAIGGPQASLPQTGFVASAPATAGIGMQMAPAGIGIASQGLSFAGAPGGFAMPSTAPILPAMSAPTGVTTTIGSLSPAPQLSTGFGMAPTGMPMPFSAPSPDLSFGSAMGTFSGPSSFVPASSGGAIQGFASPSSIGYQPAGVSFGVPASAPIGYQPAGVSFGVPASAPIGYQSAGASFGMPTSTSISLQPAGAGFGMPAPTPIGYQSAGASFGMQAPTAIGYQSAGASFGMPGIQVAPTGGYLSGVSSVFPSTTVSALQSPGFVSPQAAGISFGASALPATQVFSMPTSGSIGFQGGSASASFPYMTPVTQGYSQSFSYGGPMSGSFQSYQFPGHYAMAGSRGGAY